MSAADNIVADVTGEQYSAQEPLDKELLRERVANYASAIRPLLPALGSMGFWGNNTVNNFTIEVIDRLANAHEKDPLENGKVAYLALRRYPVTAALYSAGIGAVAGGNYAGLFGVLRDAVFYRHGQTKEKLWTELAYTNAQRRDVWNEILGRDMYFPVSAVLQDILREPLVQLIPSDLKFVEGFDRFEFFASLDHFLFNGHALGMNFLWRRREGLQNDIIAEMQTEAQAAGKEWGPLKAGLLKGTSQTDVVEVLNEFKKAADETRRAYRIW